MNTQNQVSVDHQQHPKVSAAQQAQNQVFTGTPIRTGVSSNKITRAVQSPQALQSPHTPHTPQLSQDVPERYELSCSVFLIGFMGAGKTSVARRLARICGLASVDADIYLERRCGRKVRDVFRAEGEEGFRELEANILRELAQKEPIIISCGGGVVQNEKNHEVLKTCGYTIHLSISAADAAGRITNLKSRPLFRNMERAEKLCEDRMPLYADLAHAEVDVAFRSKSSVAYEVRDILLRAGVLVKKTTPNQVIHKKEGA